MSLSLWEATCTTVFSMSRNTSVSTPLDAAPPLTISSFRVSILWIRVVIASERRATSAGSVVISRRMKSAETFSTVCCNSSILRCSGVDLPVRISMLDLTLAMEKSPIPASTEIPMMVSAMLPKSLLLTVIATPPK